MSVWLSVYPSVCVCSLSAACRAASQRCTWPHITAVKMSLDCSLTAELMSISWPRSVSMQSSLFYFVRSTNNDIEGCVLGVDLESVVSLTLILRVVSIALTLKIASLALILRVVSLALTFRFVSLMLTLRVEFLLTHHWTQVAGVLL